MISKASAEVFLPYLEGTFINWNLSSTNSGGMSKNEMPSPMYIQLLEAPPPFYIRIL